MKTKIIGAVLTAFLLVQSSAAFSQAPPLYVKPTNAATHWSSFENLSGAHGTAAKENKGGKGHAWDSIAPGETKTLMDAKGAGMINRMWLTIDDRSTETLRSLRLDMFWDNADKPAVSVPFGDFFNAMLAEPTRYENDLFSTGEGRSFNCFIPMPFRKAGRVTLTNETKKPLKHLFYDIDYVLDKDLPGDALYFHAHWHRSNPTTVGQDFEILPKVTGKGRFLGSNIAVAADKKNLGWWGEGEAKIYLDSDTEFPSLAGTGTEDYIGTAWGQKVYVNRYQGCLVANEGVGHFSFYRYHVPDPVYFDTAARVTIQQMGGTGKSDVLKMMKEGRPVKPVSLDVDGKFVRLLDMPEGSLEKHNSPDDAWCNYYRQDDVSAISFFYLDKPQSNLPPLAPVADRTALSKF